LPEFGRRATAGSSSPSVWLDIELWHGLDRPVELARQGFLGVRSDLLAGKPVGHGKVVAKLNTVTTRTSQYKGKICISSDENVLQTTHPADDPTLAEAAEVRDHFV
jgi:hypothetical protein